MKWNDHILLSVGVILGASLMGAISASMNGGAAEILDVLVKFSNIFIAPLTFALVWLSYILATETKKTRLQNKEPHIIVTIEPSTYIGFFDVVIENIGSGPAFDISVSFNPEITIKRNKDIVFASKQKILNIPTLKPKQRYSSFIGNFRDISQGPSSVVINCCDEDEVIRSYSNTIDISVFEGMSKLGGDKVEKITESLDRISKSIHNLSK